MFPVRPGPPGDLHQIAFEKSSRAPSHGDAVTRSMLIEPGLRAPLDILAIDTCFAMVHQDYLIVLCVSTAVR